MMNFPANGVSIAQTKSSLFLSSLSTTPGQEETILKWETKKKNKTKKKYNLGLHQ